VIARPRCRVFHGGLWSFPADGQAAGVVGGSAMRVMSWVQAVSQGQSRGRCMVMRRAEVATRHGRSTSLRRTVVVVARARSGAASAPAARVRLNATTAGRQRAPAHHPVTIEHEGSQKPAWRSTPLNDAPARTWRIWAGGDAHPSPSSLPTTSSTSSNDYDNQVRIPYAAPAAPAQAGDQHRHRDPEDDLGITDTWQSPESVET